MNRRGFLKWLTGASAITAAAVAGLYGYGVLRPELAVRVDSGDEQFALGSIITSSRIPASEALIVSAATDTF